MTQTSSPLSIPRRLVLVGLRGSGKTTVGRNLAQRLRLPFHDSDLEIARAFGSPAGDLLAHRGEAEFRACERSVVERLTALDRAVLALGGGAPMQPEIRRWLDGWVGILLDAPDDVLVDRIRRDRERGIARPALTERTLEEEMAHLRSLRFTVYGSCANFAIDTATGDPQEIAASIVARLTTEE